MLPPPIPWGRENPICLCNVVYAETQVAAGDTCYLMPGHTETIGLTGAPLSC